jgi:hypothetical protein
LPARGFRQPDEIDLRCTPGATKAPLKAVAALRANCRAMPVQAQAATQCPDDTRVRAMDWVNRDVRFVEIRWTMAGGWSWPAPTIGANQRIDAYVARSGQTSVCSAISSASSTPMLSSRNPALLPSTSTGRCDRMARWTGSRPRGNTSAIVILWLKKGTKMVIGNAMSDTCGICDGCGWVCENHPDRPWIGTSSRADACDCGGAGVPCSKCNPLDENGQPTKSGLVVVYASTRAGGYEH